MTSTLVSKTSDLEVVDCPICGPSQTTVWMDDGKPTRYVRCRTCDTVYASPRSSQATRHSWLDNTFGIGPNAFENAAGRRPALAREAAIIHEYVSGGAMLDLGCDLGIFFEWFASPAWERFGAELSPSAAGYAAQTYAAQVYAGTVQEAAFPDAFFDLVTMIDMFYYIDNPRADLQEVARILKPGGCLAIEFPGQAYLLQRSRGLLCWLLERRWTRLHTDSSYLFWFTPNGLQLLLEDCGFKKIACHVIGGSASSNQWHNGLAAVYDTLINTAIGFSPKLLSWAPKYLILAERTGEGCKENSVPRAKYL